jgi:hypothetical protein
MKKAFKQIVLCLTVLSLLGFHALVPCSAESSELLSYNDAITRLNSISLTDREQLELVYESFKVIGSRYFAPQYMYLTEALLELYCRENIDFNRIEATLTILNSNRAFVNDYIANDSLCVYVREEDGTHCLCYNACGVASTNARGCQTQDY